MTKGFDDLLRSMAMSGSSSMISTVVAVCWSMSRTAWSTSSAIVAGFVEHGRRVVLAEAFDDGQQQRRNG
ncbi:MAG: hypothetical protein U1E33_03860 [Rhodospirillales bacterium]